MSFRHASIRISYHPQNHLHRPDADEDPTSSCVLPATAEVAEDGVDPESNIGALIIKNRVLGYIIL